MKDKTQVTAMTCTAANGMKMPIALIGKAKKPACFELIRPGQKPLLPHKSQKNPWFDKDTTLW